MAVAVRNSLWFEILSASTISEKIRMSDSDTELVAQYMLIAERRQPSIILWGETVSANRATKAHVEEMLWQKLSHPRHSGRRGNPRPTGVQLIDVSVGEIIFTVLAADLLRGRAVSPVACDGANRHPSK